MKRMPECFKNSTGLCFDVLGSTLYMQKDIDKGFKMLAKIVIIGLGNAIKK